MTNETVNDSVAHPFNLILLCMYVRENVYRYAQIHDELIPPHGNDGIHIYLVDIMYTLCTSE